VSSKIRVPISRSSKDHLTPCQLRSTHAGCRGPHPRTVVPITHRQSEPAAQLLHSRGTIPLNRSAATRPAEAWHGLRVTEEVLPRHRVTERATDQPVHVLDALHREPALQARCGRLLRGASACHSVKEASKRPCSPHAQTSSGTFRIRSLPKWPHPAPLRLSESGLGKRLSGAVLC
jgi:hypothetical protein